MGLPRAAQLSSSHSMNMPCTPLGLTDWRTVAPGFSCPLLDWCQLAHASRAMFTCWLSCMVCNGLLRLPLASLRGVCTLRRQSSKARPCTPRWIHLQSGLFGHHDWLQSVGAQHGDSSVRCDTVTVVGGCSQHQEATETLQVACLFAGGPPPRACTRPHLSGPYIWCVQCTAST